MRIEQVGNYWVIVRGQGSRERGFFCFVNHDGSSWTTGWVHRFRSLHDAEEALAELRRRARLQRKGKKDA